jgi:hypothetical protein
MAHPSFAADTRPLAVDDTETALFEGEAVVFREATKSIHRLNASAAAVWVCCDGETTVADMVAELADVFATGTDETGQVVLEALGQLAVLGLLAGTDAPPSISITGIEEQLEDGTRIISCPPDT